MVAILDIRMEPFSNSESPCLPNASHLVSAESDLPFGSMSFENFENGHHSCHLGKLNRTILAILNLHVSSMPPNKFLLNPTYHLGADVVQRF